MRVYTSCAGCGEQLKYLGERRATTHHGCHDPEQAVWNLEEQFLAAVCADEDQRAEHLAATLDGLGRRPPRLAEAALAYAGWGWPVFPLKPGQKTPATRNGFKDATTDAGRIRAWWADMPQANVGVATGHQFDAIDIDLRHHGVPQDWLEMRGHPDTPACHGINNTANGGLHALVQPTGAGNGAALLGVVGIDYRGLGGYIVVPPSRLADGGSYAWQAKPSPAVKNRAPAATVVAA